MDLIHLYISLLIRPGLVLARQVAEGSVQRDGADREDSSKIGSGSETGRQQL